MMTRLVMIDGVEHTVITPIVNTVINDISSKFIKADDVFINKVSMYEQENAELPDNVYDNPLNGTVLDVSYEIVENEELRLTTSNYKPLNRIIIQDKQTGFHVRPQYLSTDINFSFTFNAQVKSKVHRILNRLKSYYTSSGYTVIHKTPYSYLLPDMLLDLITEMGTMQGYSSLDTYMEDIEHVKLDKAIKRGSDYTVPSFRGVQSNIIGTIMTEPSEQTITKDGGTTYTISFDYTINIQQPIALAVQYPILVNNKPLSDKWIPEREIGRPIPNARGAVDIGAILRATPRNGKHYQDIIYRIPDYDRFVPGSTGITRQRIKLISLLLEVDPNDDTLILNFDDLHYVGIPEYIIDYFKNIDNPIHLFVIGNSLFHLELFRGNYIKDYGMFVDANGLLRTTKPMDIHGVFHLVINTITDLGILYQGDASDPRAVHDEELLQIMNINYERTEAGALVFSGTTNIL